MPKLAASSNSNQAYQYVKKLLNRDRWPHWMKLAFHRGTILVRDMARADLGKQASAMAYITLLSLVPSLAAIFSLISLFLPVLGNAGWLMDEARSFILKYLATGSGEQVVQYLDRFIASLNLKTIGISAFAGLMFTLVLLLRQIEEALNRIWMVKDVRSMVARFLYFWVFVTLGTFLLSLIIGLSAKFSITALITKNTLKVASHADNIPILSSIFTWSGWCILFFIVYKAIPNTHVKRRSACLGALLGGTLFYLASTFYGYYVRDFTNYRTVYGTLSALPMFLFWIYICWTIVLVGALFAWRLQTGFPPETENKSVETAHTALEEHRNLQIRQSLPMMVLFAIHQEFISGKAHGISEVDLTENLRLPLNWINDAVCVLKELNLVVSAKIKTSSTQLEVSNYSDHLFPALPTDQIDAKKVAADMAMPFNEWLAHWQPMLSPAAKQAMTECARSADAEFGLLVKN